MNSLVAVVDVISIAIQFLIWLLIAWAILSWLVAFNVINTRNEFVRTVLDALDRLINPLLRPIRRILPNLGGIDLSPMVLILLLILVQRLLPALLIDTGVV